LKLRTQLLLAGALTLLLPLLAYRAVHQLDSALRESRSDDLLERAHAAATLVRVSGLGDVMNVSPGAQGGADGLSTSPAQIYAERLKHSIHLDGYADDWASLRQKPAEFRFQSSGSPNSASTRNSRSTRSDDSSFGTNASSVISSRVNTARNSRRNASETRPIRVRTAISGTGLYLFFEVTDGNVLLHDPTRGLLSTGDQIEVSWYDESNQQNRRVFRAVAPGVLQGHYYGRRFEGLQPVLSDPKTRGVFEITNRGYQMEIRIPLPKPNSAFGFAVLDRDVVEPASEPGYEFRDKARRPKWAGTLDPFSGATKGILVYPSQKLQDLMEDVVAAGSRLRLFDRAGFMRVDVNRFYEREKAAELIDPHQTNFFNAVLFRFFEWIIRKRQLAKDQSFTPDYAFSLDEVIRDASHNDLSNSDTDRQVGGESDGEEPPARVRSYMTLERDHAIGALEPLSDAANSDAQGWLLYETNEDNTNAFTSSAMVRVFSLVTAVSMLVSVCLLGFATWLSFRIRRLSRAARSAVNRDGRFVNAIEGSSSRDEIGDLSRDFASLVDRSRGYTQYLESLSAKLSHELRTPLSVVQTSLENIDQESMGSDARDLLARAQGGSEQLSRLLRSMSEAARLEQSIAAAEYQDLELAQWVSGLVAVYQDIYPEWQFDCKLPEGPVNSRVVPELLLQALDKLVSNSTDFAPLGSTILLELACGADGASLSVLNHGSKLDESIRDTLFDAMVSSRTPGNLPKREQAPVPHLGLGLYIVRLVAECHQGKPFAANTASGVRIGFGFSRGVSLHG